MSLFRTTKSLTSPRCLEILKAPTSSILLMQAKPGEPSGESGFFVYMAVSAAGVDCKGIFASRSDNPLTSRAFP